MHDIMRSLLLILASCLLTAAEPAVSATTAVAQHALDVKAKYQQFYDWAWVDALRRVPGQQPWRPDAERFLSSLARAIVEQRGNDELPEIIAAGRQAIAAGCDDPLVRLRLGIVLDGSKEGKQLVVSSIPGLRARHGGAGAYPAVHLVSALRRQIDPRTHTISAEAARDLPDIIVTACHEALNAPCGRAIGVDVIVDWLLPLISEKGLNDDDVERMLTALEGPAGDPVVAGVLRGQLAINAAWKARGGGWANTVTEKGWQGFKAELAEARRCLSAAWEALPESPTAANLMITVAMGDGNNDAQQWFDRAVAADPASTDAWGRMSNALLPRWGGSTQQLLELAQRAIADAKPGNRLDRAASNVLLTFVDEGGDETEAWEQIAQLDALCPPHPGPGRIFRAMGVAWHAGRQTEAQEMFARMGGLAAPATVLNAAPLNRNRGMRLLSAIERARLDQAEPTVRPIPVDGNAHRLALHGPTFYSLLPGWWQAHAQHVPAWDDRIRAQLNQHATGAATTFGELVDAGCTDPVVRFIASNDRPNGSPVERRATLLACWNELEAAGYPPVVVWQPAWFLIRELYQDKNAAAERAALTTRFADLAGKLALSSGSEGVTAALALNELGDLPAPDPALLALLDRTAAMAGIEPALASGITGFTSLARAQRLRQNDAQQEMMAWTAITRLWPAWNAYHNPRVAAALSTASCLAGLKLEARCWFDESVRVAYDDNVPWSGLNDGYAQTGSPDELMAFANEIAALPVSSGATLRALDPVLLVLRNRYLHTPELLQSAWDAVDIVTSGTLADHNITADLRGRLLYWRVACAALAGDRPAVTAALQALGTPYDPKRLPQGINPAAINKVVAAALPEAPVKPSGL